MSRRAKGSWGVWGGLGSLCLLMAVGTSGCQSSIGGQTLPSPYYLDDDIQYFPAGHEFKLFREAAALQAARESEELVAP